MRSNLLALALCAAFTGFACPAFAQMDNDFSTGGAMKIGTSTTTCNAGAEGAIRYNSTTKCMDVCEGSTWKALHCSGGAIVIGESTATCTSTLDGAIRYKSGCLDYCDGMSWKSLCGVVCPTSGLVGHWQLNDGTGSTNAADSSGSGNTGTLTNMDPNTDWVTGNIGGALEFDGVNDKVDLPTTVNLSMTNAVSIAAWFKSNHATAIQRIFEHGAITSPPWLEYSLNLGGASAGKPTFELGVGASNTLLAANTSYQTGVWTHVTATWDGATMRIYINGTLDNSTARSGPITQQNNVSSLGYTNYGGSTIHPFNGLIDDVRVYNRALGAAEVVALYNGSAGCQ